MIALTDLFAPPAAQDHGVLTVSIPKLPEAPKPEPKRITVQGA